MRWTRQARADLRAIHDYIAKDSKINAATVSREMLRRADSLADLPHLGRKVPELNDETVREIPVHSWRLIYHLRQNGIFVIALVHKRRDLLPEQITP